METRKLFYEDANRKQFCATVLECVQTEKGYAVILDQTAFYPEGGGQASDKGTLDFVHVADVRERDGQIVHYCAQPLKVGSIVEGVIDWEHRFDLMQQHTGEHIVSGLINRYFGYHNTGFHVGEQVMEVDFDGPIDPDMLNRIEREANEAIWQDIPLQCWIPSPEELPEVVYRTKRPLPWPVRIVQVPGYDSCACCGIHVTTTGQVGMIKILSCVKFHQGVRLEMVCGKRALDVMCRVFDQNKLVSQAFSAKIMETGEAAQRMNEQLAAEKFRAAGLEKQLWQCIASGYAGKTNPVHCQPEISSAGVRELADAIGAVCAGYAVVYSGSDQDGYSLCIVSPALQNARELGSAAAQALNGKGGGKPVCYQGRFQTTAQEIQAYFAE